MKSSRNLKVGVTLLVAALAVGVFALVVWADGNGTYGVGRGASENIESPRYGMQDKGVTNQVEGLGNEMSRKGNAPDHDGDGIPNGQDPKYVSECDDECDEECESEAQGSGMRRNSPDNLTGLQVHVSGMEMKTMTIAEIAALWGVDAGELLKGTKTEFGLTQTYNIGSTIDDLRGEFRFSPYQIMEIAQRIKTTSVE
jgi:hypothetical protein